MNKNKILVIDDCPYVIQSYQEIFKDEKFEVDYFQNGEEAIAFFSKNVDSYFLAFVDYNLKQDNEPYNDGSEVIKHLKKIDDELTVVIVSADDSDEAYQKWIEAEADKVFYKPISKAKVLANINLILDKKQSNTDIDFSRSFKLTNMIGSSPEFKSNVQNILRFSTVDTDVLILGETGTGKELVAKAIHANSSRLNSGKFIAINCSSFKGENSLLESELFGHEKGAFTGAIHQKLGAFEIANKGTVFLDEIHHLSKEAQAKLLRACQEKKIKRVGGVQEFSVDFRLICAGKPKLREMCKGDDPSFLPDLYYRISTLDIEIAPLRERSEDVMPLLEYFSSKMSERHRKKKSFSDSCLRLLKSYGWPGNIRELENTIEKLFVIVDDSIIKKKHLPDEIINFSNISGAVSDLDLDALERLQQEQIKSLILSTLKKNNHNIQQTSIQLKIKRTTLNSKMKHLGIFDLGPEERDSLLKKVIKNLSSFNILKEETI